MDHREPLVAGAYVVAAVFFEVAQERDDPFEGEIAASQPGDLRAFVRRDEQQEQADRVAVAAYRGWPQAFDGDQVIGEERVQQLPERR